MEPKLHKRGKEYHLEQAKGQKEMLQLLLLKEWLLEVITGPA